MQQWQSEAIILSARKFAERDLLLTVFALGQGLHSGVVKAGQSKTKASIFQIGNIVSLSWSARLSDQLGSFSAELVEPIFAKLMMDRAKLQALLSISALLRGSLAERDEHDDLYEMIRLFLRKLPSQQNWFADYARLEIEMLSVLGFGLDLAECAVTGLSHGLEYISPKTGRAVIAQAAKGFEHKLFKFPHFLNATDIVANDAELAECLRMTEYFMQQNIFQPQYKQIPDERTQLCALMIRG